MPGVTPVLHNGQGSRQSIFEDSGTQHHRVGSRASLDDGRVYYYAESTGAAIVAGNTLMSEIVSGDLDNLAVDTMAVGDTVITGVTPTGTRVQVADEFAEGYLVVNDDTGEGISYKIDRNGGAAAATAISVTIRDPIAVAFGAATTVTLVKNPWKDVVISAAAQAHFVCGVPNCAVALATDAAPRWFWCQTWGVCAIWNDAATAIGAAITSGTTPGQSEITAGTDQIIGIQLFTGTAEEYQPAFLTIAP